MPWLVGALLVLAIVFFATGGVTSFCHSMAQNAMGSRQWERAQWWLDWSSRVSSQNAHGEYLRSQLARKQGDLTQMGSHLQAALKLGYSKDLLEREQTLALASLGQINEEGERKIKQWIMEPSADVADILDSYTNGLLVNSRLEESKQLFLLWEEKLPSDPIPVYRRARVAEHMSRAEDAIALYKACLEKDPKFVRARYALARMQRLGRQPEAALKLYEACAEGRSKPVALMGMAQCYKDLGEYEKARDLWKQVVDLSHEEIQSSLKSVDDFQDREVIASELGCLETEMGNYDEALKYLEMALKANPLDSIARYSYGVTLRNLGREKEAEENFERTRISRESLDKVSILKERLAREPNNTELRLEVAKIVLEHESEKTAIHWVKSIFAYDPGNREAHQFLLNLYQAKPDREKYRTQIEYHKQFALVP